MPTAMLSFSRDGYKVCFTEHILEIDRLIEAGELNGALNAIINVVADTHRHEVLHDHALYYPQLDAQVKKIADIRSSTKRATEAFSTIQLVIGTEFYPTGGHSRIAKTFCAAAQNPIVVLTDIYNKFSQAPGGVAAIMDFFSPHPVLILSNVDVLNKLKQLECLIDATSPSAVCILNHFQDPLPVLGAMRASGAKQIYYHHCDHNPSLGASINSFVHIDTTLRSQEICNSHLNSSEVYYVPMSDVNRLEGEAKFNPLHPLSTITAAGAHKLNLSALNENTYFPTEVAKLMQATDGSHHHFGVLTEGALSTIQAALEQIGVDKNKFIYHGVVPSLSEALKSIVNPVFIPSFPIGAGLTTIEMCANGVPMVANEKDLELNDTISAQLSASVVPDVALRWTEDRSLSTLMDKLKKDYINLSDYTKGHYLKNYNSKTTEDIFQQIFTG